MLLKHKTFAFIAIIGMATSCVNDEMIDSMELKNIDATIDVLEDPESRASVDPESLDGSLAWYWNPGDEIGVFTNLSENNLKYVNTNQDENVSYYENGARLPDYPQPEAPISPVRRQSIDDAQNKKAVRETKPKVQVDMDLPFDDDM
jgi:hypothetical protein